MADLLLHEVGAQRQQGLQRLACEVALVGEADSKHGTGWGRGCVCV